mmetsp:Transcript_11026/g.28676  ORF Transcript_11026/g.28676 Transcript_11026/m.28676 type:complete len:208 (+) Transcript_11026:286-909(+)
MLCVRLHRYGQERDDLRLEDGRCGQHARGRRACRARATRAHRHTRRRVPASRIDVRDCGQGLLRPARQRRTAQGANGQGRCRARAQGGRRRVSHARDGGHARRVPGAPRHRRVQPQGGKLDRARPLLALARRHRARGCRSRDGSPRASAGHGRARVRDDGKLARRRPPRPLRRGVRRGRAGGGRGIRAAQGDGGIAWRNARGGHAQH